MEKYSLSNEEFYQDVRSLGKYFTRAEDEEDSEDNYPVYQRVRSATDRYQMDQAIARGGAKIISKAYDLRTSRPIAMANLIDSDSYAKGEKFLSEAFVTASLEHPNIVPVYDAGISEQGKPFFVMKLIEGSTVEEMILRIKSEGEPGDYSLQKVLDIFLKVCDAIEYAHSKGVVHLDLKPANIQIGPYGEVLVCDWGIARLLEDVDEDTKERRSLDPIMLNDYTLDGVIKGSPGYIAPEQVDSSYGNKDEQTDIYALGALLYFLLAFRPPVKSRNSKASLIATLEGRVRNLSERKNPYFKIPEAIAAIAMKALKLDPEQRYESVSEMRSDIEKWREGYATSAEQAGFMRSLVLLFQRHQLVGSLILVFSFILAVSITQLVHSERLASHSASLAARNEARANLNEKRALDALRLYELERLEREKMASEAAPALMREGIDRMCAGSLMDAKELLEEAVDRDSGLTYAYYNLALIALAELEFYLADEYLKIYQEHSGEDVTELREISQLYSRVKKAKRTWSVEDLKSLIVEINDPEITSLIAANFYRDEPALNDVRKVFGLITRQANRSEHGWHYSLTRNSRGYSLSLNGHKKVNKLTSLRGLYFEKLDLSEMRALHGDEFRYLSAKDINIIGTLVSDLSKVLNVEGLVSVEIAIDQYEHIQDRQVGDVRIIRR
ncbi:serine/threonine-protein kinase [Persicirhabdus sediminis]|uniref:Serine/threonine protein kinase n=1 Tax=Persicirhabdus sediminis TaxID=454144 RepID=A0A8J7MCC0_9BACT|nr:serine/threonine-protein kinase [Persicirhabdus sediminis]MBK1789973.1 serine/threonine protein kinase [Persicirhabdus sediminis]